MLNRRTLLAAGAALATSPALAAERRARAHKPAAEAGPPETPATTALGPVDTAARYALVMDFNTGATLLDKEADTQMPPSSMTKLMTAYIVYGMLKLGRLKLDQELPVSQKAWEMQGSKMFVPFPGNVRVEDLIRGMIIQSGNDACIVLAEAIAGSEDQFVTLMNAKAAELGLTNTHFATCTGWPDPTQHMSSRDIATLAGRLIRDFPEYYHFDSEKSFKYNGIDQQNRNPLVQKGIADGLKTGHTDAGGFGLVASAERSGRRVIVVVNGCTSMHQRGEEAEKLLEWSYREFENVTLVHRRRHGRTREGLAGRAADGAAGGRARPGDHHAAAMAEYRQDRGAIRAAGQRADQPGRYVGQADGQRPRRAEHGSAAARGGGRAARRPAGSRGRRAQPLCAGHLRRALTARGVFIVLEGGDGAGKGGAIVSLAAALRDDGHDVLATREPGGTQEGLQLRALLLAAEGAVWDPGAELLLMTAARVQHVTRVIAPALAVGTIVLCDRFVGSSLAYQGGGRGIPPDRILDLHRRFVSDLWPDLTVLLDVDPTVGLARSRRRLGVEAVDEGRFEALDRSFHERVRLSFLDQAKRRPLQTAVIDASRAIGTVQQDVIARVRSRLAELRETGAEA